MLELFKCNSATTRYVCVRTPNASNSVRGFLYPGVTKDVNNIINNNTSNHNRISITHLLAFSQRHVY